MKPRSNQPGARENTASSRQHASRLAVATRSNAICFEEENPPTRMSSPQNGSPAEDFENPLHAAPQHAATEGESRGESHFLTVHEVAALLQVPVSWIYGRMRKRSPERLPGYRLGKYWRFRQDEVVAWVQCHRGGSRAA
jgi:excisionase family DNA binding protein